jgi:hypothetical protein
MLEFPYQPRRLPRIVCQPRPRFLVAGFGGDVDTPSPEAAEAEAVRAFGLTAEQRGRLVVQERG